MSIQKHQRLPEIKKSKHEHLEGMTGMLRGGMDNLAGAINRLSSLSPISKTEI